VVPALRLRGHSTRCLCSASGSRAALVAPDGARGHQATVRRFRCVGCGHAWRQDTRQAAEPRSKLSRRALGWAFEALVVAHLSVARIAEALAVSWNTANSAVLAEGRRLIPGPDPVRHGEGDLC